MKPLMSKDVRATVLEKIKPEFTDLAKPFLYKHIPGEMVMVTDIDAFISSVLGKVAVDIVSAEETSEPRLEIV